MNRVFTISFGMLIMFHISVAQVPRDKLILTKEQSDAWLHQVELAPINIQLDQIRDRILLDTNVYVRSSHPDRIKLQNESANGKKNESYGRPFIVIAGKCKHHHVNITNRTRSESVRHLAELLTTKNIDSVTVHKDDNAAAIYGARATGGIIILSAKKRTVCKRLAQIGLD